MGKSRRERRSIIVRIAVSFARGVPQFIRSILVRDRNLYPRDISDVGGFVLLALNYRFYGADGQT